MAPRVILAIFGLLAFTSYVAFADPSQLQDFCVGVNNPKNGLFVNGLFCKDPKDVTADDFHFQGIDKPRNTNNQVGTNVTRVTAANIPGLNTLGVSIARIDFGPFGVNTPHTHPRATELLTVLEGTIYAGFVTANLANGDNKVFAKVLHKGDVFVFPQGMIHFEANVGKKPAVALSSFNSQNPGAVTIAAAIFGSKPSIDVGVLSTSFRLSPKIVKNLQRLRFG